MAYVALRRLRWGDGWIEPGEPVPEEEGRNYASLLSLRHIVESSATEEMSDEQLRAHADGLQKQLDEARARITELEDGGNQQTEVEVPEDVTPGVTSGWPLDATTGQPLALTDEQRSSLADQLPEGTEENPVKAIVTDEGEFVLVSGGDGTLAEEAPADAEEKAEEGKPKASSEKTQAEPKTRATSKRKPASKSKAKASSRKGK